MQKHHMTNSNSKPSFKPEDNLPYPLCGVDEVGRGPLAGPVTAAAVIIPHHVRDMDFIKDITDSKKLSAKKRDVLCDLIKEHCIWSIASATVEEIDEFNILRAALLAMNRAVSTLSTKAEYALIDGHILPQLPCPAQAIKKGDTLSVSIAAASIIAKVHRDREMEALAKEFPYYGWERNAGYGTKKHMDAMEQHGITPHHRQSFAPVDKISKNK